MKPASFRSLLVCAMLACTSAASPARAHDPSAASTLSLLPVAVSVAAPAAFLSGVGALTVVAVDASLRGTVIVLERARDGARISLTLSGQAVGAASLAAGTVLAVSAIGSGWVISAAGEALAFIPNEIGKALLHNEQVTR
jgi:hypothetical protein